MMPSPEYERFAALNGKELEAELQAMGLHDYAGDSKSYRARLARLRELEAEGKGPGAWFERFIHECAVRSSEQRSRGRPSPGARSGRKG